MTKEQDRFALTKHAQDRIRERFPDAVEELKKCQNLREEEQMMKQFLRNADPVNSLINDTVFMQYLYEEYGYDTRYRFFANKDMLFIGVEDSHRVIVTVVNRNTYGHRHVRAPEKKLPGKIKKFRRGMGEKRLIREPLDSNAYE